MDFDMDRFKSNWNKDEDTNGLSSRQVVGEVTDVQAIAIAEAVVEKLESMRKDLARAYAAVPGGTPIEHEIGETMTQIRKSLVRTRKAIANLSQQKLPHLND